MRSSAFLPKTPSMEAALIGLMLVLFSSIFQADAHSVEVRHCVTTDGNLRIFFEHWHGDDDFDIDDDGEITIRNDVTGVTSTMYPTGFVDNVDIDAGNMLPGCPKGITPPVASTCNNNYSPYYEEGWVYFDFPFSCDDAMDISYTIINGRDYILDEACPELFPVTIKPTSYQEICTKECIDVTVQIKTDLYPEETSWKIKDANGNVVMRKKNFEDSSSLYKNTKCLPKTETCQGTDYTFTINDSEGNGICCGKTGRGYYNVLVDGVEVATGGNDFNYEKSISLCGSPPSCKQIEKRKMCKETDGCFWKSNNRGGGFCRQCASLTRKSQCLKQGCPCDHIPGRSSKSPKSSKRPVV